MLKIPEYTGLLKEKKILKGFIVIIRRVCVCLCVSLVEYLTRVLGVHSKFLEIGSEQAYLLNPFQEES